MKRLAFECCADENLFRFLRGACKFSIEPFHAFGQGEVINSVLVKRTCHIGIVDEDPRGTRHRERDRARIVRQASSLEVRSNEAGSIIIIKPDLEHCFLRSLKLAGMSSALPARAEDIHGILNIPNTAKHRIFEQEFQSLYELSKERRISTLPTELEEAMGSTGPARA